MKTDKGTFMKVSIIGLTVFITTSLFSLGDTPELTLVADGQPTARIVLAKEPNRAAVLAAAELRDHIQKITGAQIPIITDELSESGIRILVGESDATRALGLKSSDFKTQEYVIRTFPNTLVLMGRDKLDPVLDDFAAVEPKKSLTEVLQEPPLPTFYDEQATCYAVYDFLEQYCGVRWFNPTDSGTIYPQSKTLTVRVNPMRRTPAFATRIANMTYGDQEIRDASIDTFWSRGTEGYRVWEEAAYSELRQRIPDNGRYGGPYALAKRRAIHLFMHRMRAGGNPDLCGHSFASYWDRFWRDGENKTKFFEEKRPDYFAKGYEGAGEPPQLCYTSRSLIEQVAADARNYYDTGTSSEADKANGRWKWLPSLFDLEPSDNNRFCKCPECQKWYDVNEKPTFFSSGQHSDYWFNFVNEVVRELRKTHPDKTVITLAYWSHAAPPTRVKIDPGVAVKFCFTCNRVPWNRKEYDYELGLLDSWGQETQLRPMSLYLYYCFPFLSTGQGTRFHCFPGFFAHTIGEQFKRFHHYGYTGFYHDGYGQQVEAYITYKLMDDPTLDVEQMLDEYFQKLYGAAAAPLKQFYVAIEEAYSNPTNYPSGSIHQSEAIAWGRLGTEARMKKLGGLMAQATAAASTDLEKHRVALFDKDVWQYMLAGRAKYLTKQEEIISLKEAQPLPDKWKVKMDPANDGMTNGWFNATLDTSSWKEASTLNHLENQGFHDYQRAWYRTSAEIPKENEGKKIILYLGAVDETCWVWINGRFAGEYLFNSTLDADSWQNPLRFDITGLVVFGETNQITVLVENSAGAGGLWKQSYLLNKPFDWSPPKWYKVISQPSR